MNPAVSKRITTPVPGEVIALIEFQEFIGLGATAPQFDPREAAIEKAENHTKRVFREQQWKFVYDSLDFSFYIPLGFLKTLDKIEVFQKDGTSEEIDTGDYEVQFSTEFLSRVNLLADSWPATDKLGGYVVTATLGWPTLEQPAGIKQAVKHIAASIYSGDEERIAKMPQALAALAKWRLISL